MQTQTIKVLSVEDNQYVADALERKLSGDPRFEWLGWASSFAQLDRLLDQHEPTVVCLDYNIPGQDSMAILEHIGQRCPNTRVMILSGDTSQAVVDKVVQAGAWGFVSKAENSLDIVTSILRVARGEFVLGEHHQVSGSADLTAPGKRVETPKEPPRSAFAQWIRGFIK